MTGSTGTPVTAAAATEVTSDPWRVVGAALRAAYRTGSMVRGREFLNRIVDAAEAAGHHPDIDLRYATIHLALVTHSANRLTEADVALANTIAEIAVEMNLEPLPVPGARYDIAIDALDIPSIEPFWRAILGYDTVDDEARDFVEADLVDPDGRGPSVWFQQMDEPRPQRSRMHIDLWVPHDAVHSRIQAALEAGGQLLTDQYAPSFWVLADAEGNEICLCTWQDRGN